MQDHSKILWEAYQMFQLDLGGKKVPTPYRRNDLNNPQEVGPEFQGKSSPEVITEATKRLADEQGFDLESSDIESIRDFMRKNLLGIDCSGFAYRCLDHLVQKLKQKPLTELGFEHVGRTNVKILTDDDHSIKVDTLDIRPSDIIRLNTNGDILHCMLVMEIDREMITYTHSSGQTQTEGVHIGHAKIVSGGLEFDEDLGDITYQPQKGDGIRRLKALV